LTYGRPWRHACPLADPDGSEKPEDLLEIAKARLADMDAVMTLEQREAVANLAVFGFIPMWLYQERLKLRAMPEDARNRQALLTGLDAVACMTSERRAA
jgi:hypothetical protein